jgi:sugar phosphate isomerase/epimerase
MGIRAVIVGALAVLAVCASSGAWAGDLGIHIANWRPRADSTLATHPDETTPEDLAALRALGFRYVRMGTSWATFEPSPGVYAWNRTADFVAAAQAQGLTPVLILGGGHPVLTGDADRPPETPDQIKAFASFAAQAAARFGPDVVWEIWNEPDLPSNWQGHVDPAGYAAVASAACAAMKQAAPGVRVVGPAIADVPTLAGEGWGQAASLVEAVIRSPAGTCLDALTVHPYRRGGAAPERALRDYAKIRAFIARTTPAGQKPLPLAVSEWGFSTGDMPSERQADWLVRAALVNKMAELPFSVFYEWRDSPHDDASESQYGLLAADRTEKPALVALRAALAHVADATFVRRLKVGTSSDFVLELRHPDQRGVIAFWTVLPPEGRRLSIGDRVVSLSAAPNFVAFDGATPAVRALGDAARTKEGKEGS